MSTESQEHTFEVGSPANLVVKNVRGHVHLVPGEEGKIKVEVLTHPGDGNPDYTEVELTQSEDGTVRAVACRIGLSDARGGMLPADKAMFVALSRPSLPGSISKVTF